MSYTNRMVAHLWANQSKPSARSSHGSISFEGNTLYSYGVPIAQLIRERGETAACLFNSQKYSLTTSSHQSEASSALTHDVPCVCVPDLGGRAHGAPDHAVNLRYLRQQLSDKLATARRSNTRYEWAWSDVESAVSNGNRYLDIFGLSEEPRFAKPEGWQADYAKCAQRAESFLHPDPESADRRERERARRIERKREREEKAHQEYLAKLADDIEAWKAGNGHYLPYGAPMLLRLKPGHPDVLETSRGAEVPLQDAVRIFRLAQRCRDSQLAFDASESGITNRQVGHFRLDSIDADGTIHAGCHIIPYDESARLAASLGLLDPPPAAEAA